MQSSSVADVQSRLTSPLVVTVTNACGQSIHIKMSTFFLSFFPPKCLKMD